VNQLVKCAGGKPPLKWGEWGKSQLSAAKTWDNLHTHNTKKNNNPNTNQKKQTQKKKNKEGGKEDHALRLRKKGK